MFGIFLLVRTVSMNGKSKDMYQGKFHQYLVSKSDRGARIKVYRDNIYVLLKSQLFNLLAFFVIIK